ncbi:MAG: hypothetical protein GX621_03280, partial [Pirellulaceae bacterium]|nr:hypothetical protein [Pirellulaceae bacterium]
DGRDRELAHCTDNHQTRCTIRLDHPVKTDMLRVELIAPSGQVPAALHELRCYEA